MIPAALPPPPAARVSLAVLTISDAQRETLAAWAAKLRELLARRAACPARERNSSLCAQFASALHNTWEAIGLACAEPRAELLGEAIAAVAKYFSKAGDARAAVRSFPAVVDLAFFLAGPEPDNTLRGLAMDAERTLETIERILARGEVWHFAGNEKAPA